MPERPDNIFKTVVSDSWLDTALKKRENMNLKCLRARWLKSK